MACDTTVNLRLEFPWVDNSGTPPINETPGTVRLFEDWVTVLQLGSNSIFCTVLLDYPAWFTQVPAPGIVTSWTGQQGTTRTGAVVAIDGDYNASMIEARGLTPGATVTEQTDYLFNNMGGTGDHLSIVSLADTVPGPLYDKIDIPGFTKAIINGGSNELLRFTGTPSGGAGGTFPVVLYEDTVGGIVIPKSGAWVDITFNSAVLTTADVTTADGITFTINADGTYLIYANATQTTSPGAGRTEHGVQIVVDTGSGYGALSGSQGYAYTTNSVNDLQTAETGLVPFVAAAGDTLKVQAMATSGVVDGSLAGVATKVVIFRHDIGAFIDLTDVPSSYAGAAGQMVVVNGTEDGLEFTPATGGAPSNATYVTMTLDGTLTNERVLTAGDGLALTDGGAGGAATLGVDISPLSTVALDDGDLGIFEDITDNSIKKFLFSTGGNAAADAGKAVVFGTDGSLTAITTIGSGYAIAGETGALNTPAITGFSTNGGEGVLGSSVGGDGVSGLSDTGAALRGTSDTGPGIHVNITDAGNTTDLALFHRDDNLGLEVENDGTLDWTTATGAQGTADNLPGVNTTGKGLAPVSANTGVKFLRDDDTWSTPATGVTSVDVSGGTTGMSFSGGPITSSGTITMSGTLDLDNGGTGATTAAGAATALGLGTGDSPQFAAVNIGNASDTTITRTGAGDIAVEGNQIYRAGGTDVPVADGGTGLSSGTSGGVPYFSASNAMSSSAALTANAIMIGGGAGAAPSTTTTGSGVLTFIGTPSSANLAAALTDEAGTGVVMFGASPGSQTVAATITWTAGADPSGATNNTYNWTRVGSLVIYQFTLTYATAGTTVTNLTIALPGDMPAPFEQSGLTGASNYLYPTFLQGRNGATGNATTNLTGALRRNSGDTAYEFFSVISSGTYSHFYLCGSYFTS